MHWVERNLIHSKLIAFKMGGGRRGATLQMALVWAAWDQTGPSLKGTGNQASNFVIR